MSKIDELNLLLDSLSEEADGTLGDVAIGELPRYGAVGRRPNRGSEKRQRKNMKQYNRELNRRILADEECKKDKARGKK